MAKLADTVIITGTSRGIGLALVRAYVDSGSAVFALCRDPDGADDLKQLQGTESLTVLPVDVSEDDSVSAVPSIIGDRPINVLVNNAGTLHVEKRPDDVDLGAWRQSFEVMTLGPFRMAMVFLPNLERAQGKMVNVTSQVGSSDWGTGGLYSYGASKAGIALIHPGVVRTALGGPSAPLDPSESANGIKAVADPLDLATTGCVVNWDGTPHAW